jgi:predicted transcriptional regulator
MSIKDALNTLAERVPGPSPSFNVLDLIRTLRLLDGCESIGRGKISGTLNLGEGTTRTILKRLTKAGLITTSKRGCSLTQKGKKFWSSIERIMPKIVEIGNNELTLAPKSVAILVKGCADKVKSGIEQRDAAVSFGAKGAVTLICRNNKLIIPGVSVDLEKDYPIAFRDIMHLINPEDGDVIIVSSADSLKEAEYGALAAAWSII